AVCSEHHAELEPDGVTLEPLLHVQFRQPLDLGGEIGLSDFRRERNDRTDAGGASLEAAECRAGTDVSGDLFVVKTVRAHTGEATKQREMLRDRAFEM